MQDFIVGDHVQFKDGSGPKMFVFSLEGANVGLGIVCQWFVTVKGNQVLKDGRFQPESLKKVEDQSEPQRVRRVHDSHHEID